MDEFYSYFLLFSSFQGIILAFVLIFKRNNPQNIWLTFLLIIFSLYLLELFLVKKELLKHFPYLMFSTYPSIYFIGPTLYIYSKKLIQIDLKRIEYYFVLGIPLFIYVLFIPYYALEQNAKINWTWYTDEKSLNYIKIFLDKGFFIMYSLLFSLVTMYNFIYNTRQSKYWKNDFQKYNWFKIFLYVFSFFLIINLIYWLVSSNYFNNSFFTLFTGLSIHFLIYTIVLQPNFYFYSSGKSQIKEAYSNSIILPEKATEIARNFLEYLKDNEPYLDDSFNLENAANHLQIQKRFLSQVISQHLNSSFTRIVKEHRVRKSVLLITQDEKRERKIADIAFASGFKDTSSFYRAFKEIKKTTPTDYRNQILS